MSAQQRYITLVKHICQIYAAEENGVAELTAGLHDILGHINPAAPTDWKKVQVDSKRLLRVWHACADEDDSAADEVVDQIAESLTEFASISDLDEKPTLEVSEVVIPATPIFKPATAEEDDAEEEIPDTHEQLVIVNKSDTSEDDEESIVEPADDEDEDEDIDMIVAMAKTEDDEEDEAIESGPVPMEEDEEVEIAADVVEEAKETEEAEKVAESEEVVEEEEVVEVEEEEEEEKEEVVEVEEEEEEIEVEEEEAEEEEEGLEVEQRVIRGRPYWVDVNTNKLYAVVGDEDVGDEVGAIINGKPVFKAT